MTGTSIEHPELPGRVVTLRRSRRSRRMSLRVSSLDGRITLTVPPWCTERQSIRFVGEQIAWLRDRVDRLPPRAPVSQAGILPYLGRDLCLVDAVTGPVEVTADGTGLAVPADPAKRPAALTAFYRFQARHRLAKASDRYAARIGAAYTRLTLRDTRSRWGSCSAQGGLMYSWRLIMVPPAVLDYVAAHEVAHLRHMNHGADFWALVEDLCPTFRDHRNWLREHGQSLHHWDFAN